MDRRACFGCRANSRVAPGRAECVRHRLDRSDRAVPEIEPGPGRVVLGRFISRDVEELLRLTLSDDTTIDVTPRTYSGPITPRLDCSGRPGEWRRTQRAG